LSYSPAAASNSEMGVWNHSRSAFAVLQLVPRPSLTDLFDKALGRGFDGTKR